MMEHAQALRVLRQRLRSTLVPPAGRRKTTHIADKATLTHRHWEAVGVGLESYQALGDDRFLFDYLVACHNVDPQDALAEIATLPQREAEIRHRAARSDLEWQRSHTGRRRRRLRTAA